MTRSLLSAAARGCRPFGLAGLLARSAAAGAIDLAVGLPGLDPPRALRAAAVRAAREGPHQALAPGGHAPLRAAIAAAVGGVDADAEVTITCGATEGVFAALVTLVDPGDEVILFEPFYGLHQAAIRLVGAVPRLVPLVPGTWRLDPAALSAAVGPRTRALLMVQPNNPTGRVFDAEELAWVERICGDADLAVICDEVYAGFTYDGVGYASIRSRPRLVDRAVVIGSLSKTFSASGWRIGYVIAPPPISAALCRVHTVLTVGAPAPLQAAAVTAFAQPPHQVVARGARMRAARDRMIALLRRIGCAPSPPQGGIFVFARTPEDAPDPDRFVEETLRDRGVLFAPGTLFFEGGDARWIRACFARTEAVLAEAERRLGLSTG